jgi:hypothetical protein
MCTRAMLFGKMLPLHLWGGAPNHAVFLKNCSHTRTVATTAPYEAWLGSRPDLSVTPWQHESAKVAMTFP